MRRANRILLMASVFAVSLGDVHAGLWKSRKPAAEAAPVRTTSESMALTRIEVEGSTITVALTGSPAYTSYSPAPQLFVVDLTSASRGEALSIPSTLPPGVLAISAEEATEMGVQLTRITFRLAKPMNLQVATAEKSLIITVPEMVVAAAAPAPAQTVAATQPASAERARAASESVAEVESVPAPTRVVAPMQSSAPTPRVRTATGKPASVLYRVAVSGSGDDLAVALEGDGSISYKSFRLAGPDRLVLDLPGVMNRAGASAHVPAAGAVAGVRISQFRGKPNPVTRVVIDLAGTASYQIADASDGLTVNFGASSQSSVAMAETSAPVPTTAAAAPVVAVASTRVDPDAFPPASVTSEPLPVEVVEEAPRAVITSNQDVPPPNTARPAPQPATNENVFADPAATPAATEPQLLSGPVTGSGGRSLGGTQKVYSGEPLSLNLKEADIRDVIRTFSDLTGLNIAVDPQVQGRVTVNFTDVPWDQALDIILNQQGLTWVLTGNVMRIGTVERISAERAATRRLEEEERLNVPLDTVIFKLSYARAGEVQGLITTLASPRAKIIIDGRTNQLIVSDIPTYIRTMANLIETIDVPTRQVMIEARIVEASKTFQQRYGFEWSFGGAFDPNLGTGTGLVFPNRIGFTGGPFNFGPGNPVISLNLTDVLGTFNLDVALNAFEFEGLAKVVSAPKVTTQDNVAASIQSGFQIPYQTRVNFTTTIQYVDATLSLNVIPQITEAGTVIMDITVQKNEPTTGLAVEGAAGAPISTRSAKTKVMVRDGGTAVIGGIYQVKDNDSSTRLPFVHRIPVIGNLFKTHNVDTAHDELLIFITPRIIRGV